MITDLPDDDDPQEVSDAPEDLDRDRTGARGNVTKKTTGIYTDRDETKKALEKAFLSWKDPKGRAPDPVRSDELVARRALDLDPYTYRRFDCVRYVFCLTYVAALGWKGFTCLKCPVRTAKTAADQREEDAALVIGIRRERC